MRKTSVYLPDELKDDLAALARRWGRSEAELLRTAVERLVRAGRQDAAPGAAPPRRTGPLLVGVGIGPSDPTLITERAATTLRTADRVFAASTGPDSIGRAEAVVRAVAPESRVERLGLDIVGPPPARARSLEAAADRLVEALDPGAVVAFVTLGDPNVYTVFPALRRAVAARRPVVPAATVPGVMAFQQLAAEAGTVLAEHNERLVVLVGDEDLHALDTLLEIPRCTVVIYKGAPHLPAVTAQLRDHDRLDGAVMGEMLGLPGSRVAAVASLADQPASYLAAMVVPATGRHPR
jgi:precorrin-2/cobalt-factor-2 C20-methyltransferase